MLRSQLPDGVRQEVWAHLRVHYAIRWLMHTVALEADTDPDGSASPEPCGSHAAARRPTPVFPPDTLDAAHSRAREEIAFELLPPRRPRANACIVKRKMSNYGVKRAEHRNPPRPQQPSLRIPEPK